MRSCRQFLAFWALILLTAHASAAATVYIRAGATGAKNGTDWTNAYTNLPSTLVRGDIYYLATGNYPNRNFGTAESGTTLITIKKATIADHGTSTGWLDSYATGQAVFSGVIEFFTSYWVLDGQARTTTTSGHGIKIVSDYNKAIGLTTGNPGNVDNITIRYVEVQGLGMDNTMYDAGIRIVYGPQNVTIQKVYVHDTGGASIMIRDTGNLLIEDSVFARNSSSPESHAEGLSASGDANVTIRNNLFQDIEGTGFIVCLGGGANCNNWSIYGNVFSYSQGNPNKRDGVGTWITCINNMPCNNWLIYNNSILSVGGGSATGNVGLLWDLGSSGTVTSKNNLFYANALDVQMIIASPSVLIEAYNSAINNTGPVSGFTGTGDETLSGQPNPFVDWTNGNFHLIGPTKPGTPLTLPAGVTTDPRGAPRGIDGVWDRGAFEFKRSDPPTNLRTGS